MFYHRQLWCRPMRETVCTASMLTSCRRCSHGRPSDQPRPSASPENEETVISERTFREMYPRVQLKAKAQLRRTVARPLMEDPEAHGTTTTSLTTQEEKNQLAEDEEGEEKEDFTAYHNVHPTTQFTQDTADHTTQSGPEAFLEEVQRQTEELRYRRNQAIPYPDHPDLSAPEFRRIKRSAKNEVIDEEKLSDEDVPKFERRDIHVALPPPVLLHNKMYSLPSTKRTTSPIPSFGTIQSSTRTVSECTRGWRRRRLAHTLCTAMVSSRSTGVPGRWALTTTTCTSGGRRKKRSVSGRWVPLRPNPPKQWSRTRRRVPDTRR
ncbi:hypothetical protein AGDE_13389 [Angomonas deanei]|uniref:Uncharacterized protein n=1 Tax=Angomonas deanei TaxID=59799 RepID=A0A7G2C9C8_9TRYP|nr:hypothetical protein AGDE_13389 [Angomonas deanei]CAD2214612.1 hypothetical protein, conserved [Angomonas deanei]|eukprot:EPY22417.1 hypothetical protein AGDE_13389 [Angomonas deanei]